MATCYLYNKVIFLTEANSDQEHIRTIIDSNTTIPDRTKFVLYEQKKHFLKNKNLFNDLKKNSWKFSIKYKTWKPC